MATTYDRQRRGAADLMSQIPTDGQGAAPMPDGSQSNPLNNEFGRNAMNTLSALPGVSGVASRAGAGAARGAAGALSTERVIPASWEVVQEGGALARGADAGGTLSRAASTAMQQQPTLAGNAAQLLGTPPSRALAPRVGGEVGEAVPQFARRPAGPPPWADVVEPAALTAQQASPAASALSSLGGSNLGRALGTGAALGSAVIAGSTLDPNGGGDASPLGAAQAAQPAGAAAAQSPAAQALATAPTATRNSVTRVGNSYSGMNVTGDISINGAAPRGLVTSLPAGAMPTEFGAGSAALRALGSLPAPAGGTISAQSMGAADNLAARANSESMARLLASGQIAAPAPGRSMSMSGSTFGFRRAPSVVGSEIAGQQAFDYATGNDPASRRRAAALQQTRLEQQGAMDRQALQSAGTIQAAQLRAGATGGKAPDGYRWAAGGGLEAIPGGPADIKNSKEGQQQVKDSSDVISIAIQADQLLNTATGSYGGAAWDTAARAIGMSTAGGESAAQLKVLQGMLVSKMPKMSGPQSDKDVQLYREMAGQIGDATLPASTRRAALDQIYALNAKYATPDVLAAAQDSPLALRYQAAQAARQGAQAPSGSASATAPAARTVARSGVIDGRRVVQYSDGSVEYAN